MLLHPGGLKEPLHAVHDTLCSHVHVPGQHGTGALAPNGRDVEHFCVMVVVGKVGVLDRGGVNPEICHLDWEWTLVD